MPAQVNSSQPPFRFPLALLGHRRLAQSILHLTPAHCHPALSLATVPGMGHYYCFKCGDAVTIVSGRFTRCTGVVDSAVFQRTVDFPDEFAPGYHVMLDLVTWITVRWDLLC